MSFYQGGPGIRIGNTSDRPFTSTLALLHIQPPLKLLWVIWNVLKRRTHVYEAGHGSLCEPFNWANITVRGS